MLYTSVKKMVGKREGVIKKIKVILSRDTRGLTIQELSKLTDVSRITVSSALLFLEGQGIIDVRELGQCKLHYLKNEK